MKPFLFLIVPAFCGLAGTGRAALVAWYKFDEGPGATIATDQLGGSIGAVGSQVVTGVPGISGNAYRFDAPSSSTPVSYAVDMADASFFSALNATGEMTLSAWIRTTDTTDDRNTVIFAGSDTIPNNYADLGINGLIGEATARNRPARATLPQMTGTFSSGMTVNDGRWHHIAMTVDVAISQLLLYVDGVLTNSQVMTASLLPNFNNFEVGRLGRAGNPAIGYRGLVDDVQVYSSALSPEQIHFLFKNPGMAAPQPSLIALAGFEGISIFLFTCFRDPPADQNTAPLEQ